MIRQYSHTYALSETEGDYGHLYLFLCSERLSLERGCLEKVYDKNVVPLLRCGTDDEYLDIYHKGDKNAATVYGDLRATCEADGVTLFPIDLMIAAHAQAVDANLVTGDKAFSMIGDGFRVENWTTPD